MYDNRALQENMSQALLDDLPIQLLTGPRQPPAAALAVFKNG